MRLQAAGVLLLSGIAAAALGQSTEYNGAPGRSRAANATDQIIVKWRGADAPRTARTKLARVSADTGAALQRKRAITASMEVLKLERPLGEQALAPLLARLNQDPDVEYAVADARRYAHAAPSDPLLAEQWYFLSAELSAVRAEQAWDLTTGAERTIVAVLDTGVRFEHPDLGRSHSGGKVLPGFDFISDARVANDGDGRDSDASDPGDWLTAEETHFPPFNAGCLPATSSWHGTRVASLIGAATDNAVGLAGAAWRSFLLPVRVLGKCGGYDSDILAGMRWAAGLPVDGAPENPNPAGILNLSLGSSGRCSAAQQATIDEIIARGALVVASAGNDGGPVEAPANCNGVLAVAGLRHAGTKVGFSSLGPQIALGAPAGNCVNTRAGEPCLFSIVVATDSGSTVATAPGYTDRFNFNVGTSFSAPLVAGAAALMHSVNSRLKPPHYIAILRETATAYPISSDTTSTVCRTPTGPNDIQVHECICTTRTCGAGMLNAHAAVLAAQRPFAIASAPRVIDIDVDVTLDAGASFAADERSIAAYEWSVTSVAGATPAIADATQASTSLRAPDATQFILRLTVTDDLGSQGVADVMVATRAAPSQPPAAPRPSRSGGGGGATESATLAALALLVGARFRRRIQPLGKLA